MNRDFLKQLGLQKENDGTSTGQKSSNSGNYIKSYSPVDGEYIGSVSVTTRVEYDETIQTAK
jgi:aldehyde dehydrogenase (NAD+)